LDRLPVVIGRSPDSRIQLDDSWVSRRHCEIDELDGELVIRDLGSRHGTFVNGCRVTEAALMPGDKLTVGIASFRVSYRCSRTKLSPASERYDAAESELPAEALERSANRTP
jgi:pSer/pThr/pTyr-binding forkhead associated (FHA) protein